MPAAAEFFLDSDDMGDDREFLAPPRANSLVVPLIDGIPTFRVIERSIASATQSVCVAAWILNPAVRLTALDDVNKLLRSRGVTHRVSTWGELLATVAGAGAQVRILISDFDPILANQLHEAAWSAYRELRALGRQYSKGNMQIMCSLHDGVFETQAQEVQESVLTALIARLNARGTGSALKKFRDMPGLWEFVEYQSATKKFARVASPPWRVHPASHHQKLCIVDRKVGFCGGLDVQTGRLDTKEHKMLWHDTHCQVDGPLAADLHRNFIGRWNTEMQGFNSFIATASSSSGPLGAEQVSALSGQDAASAPGTGTALGQLVRTLSSNSTLSMVPSNDRSDILDLYEHAIGLATNYVYIENQYLRDLRLADWLAERSEEVPTLVVMIVLPVAPEEITRPGGADAVTRHGLYLQHDVLMKLQTSLGSRLGLYSPVERQTARRDTPPDKKRTHWANSQQIYVHSKVMIIDDVWATIGSANTSPRSFDMDTEANIHWHDPASVRKLRLDLWRELLGSPSDIETWTPAQFVAKWNAIAEANRSQTPRKRSGLIVPHDPENPAVQGQELSLLPDEFAELDDPNPDLEYVS